MPRCSPCRNVSGLGAGSFTTSGCPPSHLAEKTSMRWWAFLQALNGEGYQDQRPRHFPQ